MEGERHSSLAVIGAFILGGLVGAGIALLSAPKSGKETREELGHWAKEAAEGAREKVKGYAHEAGERVRSAVNTLKDKFQKSGAEGTEEI